MRFAIAIGIVSQTVLVLSELSSNNLRHFQQTTAVAKTSSSSSLAQPPTWFSHRKRFRHDIRNAFTDDGTLQNPASLKECDPATRGEEDGDIGILSTCEVNEHCVESKDISSIGGVCMPKNDSHRSLQLYATPEEYCNPSSGFAESCDCSNFDLDLYQGSITCYPFSYYCIFDNLCGDVTTGIEFTPGGLYYSEVCYNIVNPSEISVCYQYNSRQTCQVTVGDTACASCSVVEVSDTYGTSYGCFEFDCTNTVANLAGNDCRFDYITHALYGVLTAAPTVPPITLTLDPSSAPSQSLTLLPSALPTQATTLAPPSHTPTLTSTFSPTTYFPITTAPIAVPSPAPTMMLIPTSTPISDSPLSPTVESTLTPIPILAPNSGDGTQSLEPSSTAAPVTEARVPDAPSSTNQLPITFPAPTISPSLSTSPTSIKPTNYPTVSILPTRQPSTLPSASPGPSTEPSSALSRSISPTTAPSFFPTSSQRPSAFPSLKPTSSISPTIWPSSVPSLSMAPTSIPSTQPSMSILPTSLPTLMPSSSNIPSAKPSVPPSLSARPSNQPTSIPSMSSSPSLKPNSDPLIASSLNPTMPIQGEKEDEVPSSPPIKSVVSIDEINDEVSASWSRYDCCLVALMVPIALVAIAS